MRPILPAISSEGKRKEAKAMAMRSATNSAKLKTYECGSRPTWGQQMRSRMSEMGMVHRTGLASGMGMS